MPTFTFNCIVLPQIVGYVLAYLHVVLPTNMSATNIVAAIMLLSAAVGGVLRFYHPGDLYGSVKPILTSKTIVSAIVAAAFALLALFGVVPGIDQANVVSVAMTVATFALAVSAAPLSEQSPKLAVPLGARTLDTERGQKFRRS